MKNLKVLSVFGTRPEATKMAPLVKALAKEKWIDSKVLVTGQHREMLDQVLEIFSLKPDYDLNIMAPNQTLIDIMNKTLVGFDKVLDEVKPDIVLVHGDTSTAFAAAFTAFNKGYKVGHVEAGLRSGDKYSPFPEEMNRRLIDTICDIYFAPTEANKDNLLKENISEKFIYVTGNTSIDAIKLITQENYDFECEKLQAWVDAPEKIVLVTAHRRENIGEPMRKIFSAIAELVDTHQDIRVIYPIHLNPKVRAIAKEILADKLEDENRRVHLIEPLSYKPFANLMQQSHLIMTDSGGLQEEAPALNIPVIVLRTETERPEAVKAGTIVLAGIEKEDIIDTANKILSDEKYYQQIASAKNPYGDGTTSQQIIAGLKDWWQQQD